MLNRYRAFRSMHTPPERYLSWTLQVAIQFTANTGTHLGLRVVDGEDLTTTAAGACLMMGSDRAGINVAIPGGAAHSVPATWGTSHHIQDE